MVDGGGVGALRADCDSCFGLCCVAPAFSASADFAFDKAAGHPCPHLATHFRCGIHATLRPRGFPGCTVYDCFGAGQKVSHLTFAGLDWQQAPDLAEQMFNVFGVMRQLHELLWLITEALSRTAGTLKADLSIALDDIDRLTHGSPVVLLRLDVARHRREVNPLLRRTSEVVRVPAGPDRSHADLIGADLHGADLRGADLRGALLIGADLRTADLRSADFIGADLRGADVSGADLTGSIFLTQSQLDAARGDARTNLPVARSRPLHWRPAS